MQSMKWTGAALLALALGACAGPRPVQPVAGADSALAYGNITIPDKVLTGVMLFEYGVVYAPPFKSPPRGHTYTNGNFMFENLKPGKYFLVGFNSGQDAFYFNYSGMEKDDVEKVLVEVRPGELVYLGSYRVTGIDDHFFKADTFDIEPVQEPSEKTILQHLAQATDGTGWDAKIKTRLKHAK